MNGTHEFKAKRLKSSLNIKDFVSTLPKVPTLQSSLNLTIFPNKTQDHASTPVPDFILAIAKERAEKEKSKNAKRTKKQQVYYQEIDSSTSEEYDSDELCEIDQDEYQRHAPKNNQSEQQDLLIPLDDFFKTRLKPHQLEGVKFMWKQLYEERHGCLLSHSMGLGKTLQTIALLTTLYQKKYYSTDHSFPKVRKITCCVMLVRLRNMKPREIKY
jgi:SNF2 family DNA or RNA helicase